MYIYSVSVRAKSPQDAEQICRLIRQELSLIQEPGYYRGGCYAEIEDPRALHILQQWSSLEAVRSWRDSEAEKRLREGVSALSDGQETTSTIYEEVW